MRRCGRFSRPPASAHEAVPSNAPDHANPSRTAARPHDAAGLLVSWRDAIPRAPRNGASGATVAFVPPSPMPGEASPLRASCGRFSRWDTAVPFWTVRPIYSVLPVAGRYATRRGERSLLPIRFRRFEVARHRCAATPEAGGEESDVTVFSLRMSDWKREVGDLSALLRGDGAVLARGAGRRPGGHRARAGSFRETQGGLIASCSRPKLQCRCALRQGRLSFSQRRRPG